MYAPLSIAVTLVCLSCTPLPGQTPPAQPWFPRAPALPPPSGPVIRASNVEELFRAADTVQPGGTILLADGLYRMPRYFELRTDNVTLRGESGRRERVILDGADSRHGELLGITGCEGVTIADVTVQNVRWNGLKINSDRGTTRVTIHHCVIHNVWQRGVKGPRVPREQLDRGCAADCRIQYCLFYNDRPKQFSDDPADTPDNFGGNYVGGIDVMSARRWTIRDNVFVAIQGRTGEARGAVFLWHDAQDCIVERNVIIDCDSGICLGNSYRPADIEVHARRCLVRNNFVVRCPENGILADYTEDCRILHNSVYDPQSRLQRLIRLVHDNRGLIVANNLLSGPPPRIETTSAVRLRGNAVGDFAPAFVDAAAGDLHLREPVPQAVNVGAPMAEVTEDFDGQPRDAQPDLGADEWVPPSKGKDARP